eukprot:1780793-Alexandrium_andersonii.AAC.1
MSASLVGSEMCIRDRGSNSARRRKHLPSPTDIPVSRLPCYSGRWQCLEPVSYTHLTLPTICSV